MKKYIVIFFAFAFFLGSPVWAQEEEDVLYVQNDRLTCGCNNPLTPEDECVNFIGEPGDECPTDSDEFVQNDRLTCGCDNPTTPGTDECTGECNAGYYKDETTGGSSLCISEAQCIARPGVVEGGECIDPEVKNPKCDTICTSEYPGDIHRDQRKQCIRDCSTNPCGYWLYLDNYPRDCGFNNPDLPQWCNWNVPNSQMLCTNCPPTGHNQCCYGAVLEDGKYKKGDLQICH